MRSTLRTAQNRVDSLRLALLSPSPEEIERCLPGLTEAAGCLGLIEQQLRTEPADPFFKAELKILKNDLKMVARLIEHGAAFYRGWASLLGAAAGGYTPSGEAAEISAVGTLSIRG